MIGGEFNTFKPQPVKWKVWIVVLDALNMVQTYYDVHFCPHKTCVDQNTSYLPQLAGDGRNYIYIIWPFQTDILSHLAQGVILTTCLCYREAEQVLNEDKLRGRNSEEGKT